MHGQQNIKKNYCMSHFDLRATYPLGLIILYMTQNILKAVPRAGFESGGQCGLHNRVRRLSYSGVETAKQGIKAQFLFLRIDDASQFQRPTN